METKLKINQVPSLTWTWLKMNNDSVSLEDSFTQESAVINSKDIPQGVEIVNCPNTIDFEIENQSGVFNISHAKSIDNSSAVTGTDSIDEQKNEKKEQPLHQGLALLKQLNPQIQYINITQKISEPIILYFNKESSSKNTAAIQVITALPDTQATVIIVYKNAAAQSIVQTKVIAKENSKLHLVKVQLLPKEKLQLDDTIFECGDNSQTKFTQIELGAQHIDSGLHVNLNGYKATFESNVAYTCQNEQFLDMNHIVNHFGKKTECKMNVNGTLKDNAVKTYRGTIDFKNGCSGSKGNEMEETLLLSPVAVNKSLPVILCDEEDVEGEHGSTIGRISQDILFYMQTRGISKEEAESLITRAKIQAVADLIPSEEIKSEIINYE